MRKTINGLNNGSNNGEILKSGSVSHYPGVQETQNEHISEEYGKLVNQVGKITAGNSTAGNETSEGRWNIVRAKLEQLSKVCGIESI